MLKKEITYENFFTEEEETETFYFNLTERELTKFEAQFGGDVSGHMIRLMRENKTDEMFNVFEGLILTAYGVRDGNDFVKDQDAKDRFMNSAPYNALFIEIANDMDAFNEFFMNVIPKKIRGGFAQAEKEALAELRKEGVIPAEVVESPEPPVPPTPPSE